MRAVFISYRREDAEGQAGRLFDDLTTQFGADSVFMDVAGIEPGRDFRRAIDEQVATCGVLLAVIGKNWLDAADEQGRRRLDDPLDFVRLETASALKRDITVIPVLVRGAVMPRPEQLPPDLKELAYRNAVELTHARWDSDVQVLIKALRPHVELLQQNLGSTKSEPVTSGAAGALVSSVEAGTGGPAPIANGKSAKNSRRLIMAISLAAVLVAVGIYLAYARFAEKPRSDSAAVVEKTPAQPTSTNQPTQIVHATPTASSAPTRDTRSEPTPTPTPPPPSPSAAPTLPTSYTLAGTWQDDGGRVFATVADSKERGAFEMEQIKPRKKSDTYWKATLKGRTVEIDVFNMPSGSHATHMNLQLSLDGNRLAGLSNCVYCAEDEPATPVHFRRIN